MQAVAKDLQRIYKTTHLHDTTLRGYLSGKQHTL